jgi:hypothetical protein
MREFGQLSFGLYVNLVLMKSIYTTWQPNPHKIVLGQAVGHSQNKWLSWVGQLFWECPPPKALPCVNHSYGTF